MMLTDKGDDGDAEKSDELEAINCLTRLRKDNFETTMGNGAVLHHYA